MVSVWIAVKNEMLKFLHEKKLYILIVFIIALSLMGTIAYKDMAQDVIAMNEKGAGYSEEIKGMLLSFSGIQFARISLTDFIYKPYFSIYLIFIVLIAVNIFANDYENGTLKFSLLANIKTGQLYLGKILFMLIISMAISVIYFLISLLIGQIIFGGAVTASELIEVLMLYLISAVPALAVSSLIALFSLLRINPKVLMGIALGGVIALGVLDTSTWSRFISPIGMLSLFNDNVPVLGKNISICLGVSILYAGLASTFFLRIARKTDYLK